LLPYVPHLRIKLLYAQGVFDGFEGLFHLVKTVANRRMSAKWCISEIVRRSHYFREGPRGDLAR